MLKKNVSLRNRILKMCLLCTLLAITTQTVVSSYYTLRIFNRQAVEQNESALKNLQGELYSAIKAVETDLISIYNEKMLMRDLENGLGIDMLKKKYYEEAYTLQNDIFENEEPLAAYYLYNKKNELICSYQKSMTHRYKYPKDIYKADYDVNEVAVLKYLASSETAMQISSYYNENCQEDILRFVLKLYKNSDTSKVIGYEVCDISSSYFSNIMKKYLTSDEMLIWLQPDGDRQAVTSGKLTALSKSDYNRLLQSIAGDEKTVANNMSWAGCRLYEKPQTKYNLSVYTLMPQKFFTESMKMLLRGLLLCGVMMAVLGTLISSTISAKISRPVEKLIATIGRIRGGEAGLRVELGEEEDEIQVLGRNFNEMLDEIQELMAQKYQTQLMLNRAEYQTLQAQINPHFLYNTLDTMGSIANINHCEMVGSMCLALADIFRYTLNMTNPFASVSEETAHVRNFVYVMDIRTHSSIQYEFEIGEETYEDMLPRISMEPLIENAISHGLKNCRKKDKKIVVRTWHLKDELWVSVEDNGIGADQEQIRCSLEDEALSLGKNGKSIGLANINSRLKKLFGREYGIIFESQVDVGTKVMIHVPILNQEDAEIWLKKHTGF